MKATVLYGSNQVEIREVSAPTLPQDIERVEEPEKDKKKYLFPLTD